MSSAEKPRSRLDLRVARIESAVAHPNADRLMVLTIAVGEKTRQIVAGLVGHYQPSELPGMHIVVVANLKPARLRGEISEGMLLAAEDDDGNLGLLTAPEASPGTELTSLDEADSGRELTFPEFQEHVLLATEQGMTIDGESVTDPRLLVDRGVTGRLR